MSTGDSETLAGLIRRMRGKRSQGELAAACAELMPDVSGINQGSISKMERGSIEPSPEQLRAIVAAGSGSRDDLSRGLSLLVGVQVRVEGAA